MQVLVTGGAGFIGSHTVDLLRTEGHHVRVLDDLSTGRRENLDPAVELWVGDIADRALVTRAMDGCAGVIHLAARASVPDSCRDPVTTDHTNVHGTVVVMQAGRDVGVDRLVFASSSAVYGSSELLPKREGQPVIVESPYAASKAADELYGAVFTRTLGLPCVGLRYFNVFGPRQDPSGPYAAVIPRFLERALAGQPLEIHGDGEQSRDFVAVSDVARANLAALTAPHAEGVYNIGSGARTTVNALATQILAEVGSASPVVHTDSRPGDVRHSVADIDRAIDQLSWLPRADFHTVLAATVQDLRDRL